MNKFVLDASALLSLLNNEPGAEKVAKVLQNSIISSVNLSETISQLTLLGMPEKEVKSTLDLLSLDVIPFDQEQSYLAGMMIKSTKPFGVSFGDRACLSLSLMTKRKALTADRTWASLQIGIEIESIR